MKKIFAIVVLVIMTMCSSCVSDVTKAVPQNNISMFIEVEKNLDYNVVYHKNTKVMYVVSDGVYNRGNFTMLVDRNGKPLLYEEN